MAAKTAQQSDFAKLLQEHFARLPKVNDMVTGTVVSVDKGAVRIDINGLMIGVVRGHELFTESSEFSTLKAGDNITVN